VADSPSGVRAALKLLPSVDDLLSAYPPVDFNLSRNRVRAAIRDLLADTRSHIQTGELTARISETVHSRLQRIMAGLAEPTLTAVINATGVVLHTGLGRAPLGGAMVDRALAAVRGYSALEFDLSSGKRGQRLDIVRDTVRALTGSDGAVVVNNNAAAVLLMLNTVAEGREVIISRGQQVEIGGSFRMPDIIAKAGAGMVEIGTTNRTHLADYERAVGPGTAAILYVHPSNYRIEGFTREVPLNDLSALARRKRIPLLVDLGSGNLLTATPGQGDNEPTVMAVLKAGADLACFSGDKLLGGPQSGLLVGRAKWLKQLQQNPLYRTLRCDKLTLALLDQALRSYVDERTVQPANLTQQLLNREREALRGEADRLLSLLPDSKELPGQIVVVDSEVEAGSGSLPGTLLPSIALRVSRPGMSAAKLAAAFRSSDPPVIGYIHRNRFILDLKAVPVGDIPALARSIAEVLLSARPS
jgi:L-seryl-tRNA(Ser) seleniumtransferase